MRILTRVAVVAFGMALLLLGWMSSTSLVLQAQSDPFTGTWQGFGNDGSTMTLTLTQSGAKLQGTFKDSYDQSGSIRVEPGYQGPCNGDVTSETKAKMTCNLTRSDGATWILNGQLELSNQNNTLTYLISGSAQYLPGTYIFQRQGGSQTQPPSQQQPPVQTPGEMLERAIIFALDTNNQLRTFPGHLVVSAGGLRLTLTSLDQTLTVVLRRQGAQVGTATVLVETKKLAVLEVSLAQGVYDLLNQGTSSTLGQIEAR